MNLANRDMVPPASDASTAEFQSLLRAVRNGDEDASRNLVDRFEPIVRRAVRAAMTDRRLVRVFDSIDVSQSVFASFFRRVGLGQYEFSNIKQLGLLLTAMARNKLASRVRLEKRMKRDLTRVTAVGLEKLNQLQSPDASPDEQVMHREELGKARQRLNEEVWHMLELRQAGLTWEEIAIKIGGTAHSRRVQVMRSLRTLDIDSP